MSETAAPKSRIRSVDAFKGLAIILIVIAHLVILQEGTGGAVGDVSPVLRTIAEFIYLGLILFFVVSGYFYNPDEGFSKKAVTRLLKLIMAFVLCIVVLTTLLYLYLLCFGYNISVEKFLETMINELAGGGIAFTPFDNTTSAADISECGINAGYYFIIVLITSTALYHLISRWSMKDIKNTVISIVVLLTVTMLIVEVVKFRLPYYLELAPIATAAMLIGSTARKYDVIRVMEEHTFDKKIVLSFVIALVVGILLCYSDLRSDLGFHRSHFGLFGGWSAYTILIVAMAVGYAQLYIVTLLSKIPYFSDMLIFVGKYSLGILMLSTFFCIMVIAPFKTIPATTGSYPVLTVPEILVVAAISIFLCIGATHVVKRLYGKIREKKGLAA